MYLNSSLALAIGQIKTSETYQAPDTSLHVLKLPPGPACRDGNCHGKRGARHTLGKALGTNGTTALWAGGPRETGRVVSLGQYRRDCGEWINHRIPGSCPPSGRD